LRKTALFCWEIGQGLGHITALKALGDLLTLRGYRCIFAVKDLTYAYELLHANGHLVLQAPLSCITVKGAQEAQSYADILLRFGFINANALTGQVIAWQTLINYVKPDVFVLDSAPVARLAAMGLEIPIFNLSVGFACPPAQGAWPVFPALKSFSAERLKASEALILENCHIVSARLRTPSITRLGELYPIKNCYINAVPALDPYERHSVENKVNYVGAFHHAPLGIAATWPVQLGPREKGEAPKKCFAYLKADYPELPLVLNALASLPLQTIAFIPGLSSSEVKHWSKDNLLIATAPINTQSVLLEAGVVLGHAGASLTHQALLAGLPVFALPMHTEQLLTANKITRSHLGSLLNVGTMSNFKKAFKQFLLDSTFNSTAQNFASGHPLYKTDVTMQSLAGSIAAL
jgi:hypothetical protein